MNKGYTDLWPTTVYLGDIEPVILEEVCQVLFSEVNLKRPSNEFQGFDPINHGSEVFQRFRDQIIWPAFEQYLTHVGVDINEFPNRKLRSWLTGAGYMIPIHNHSGASVSAVFYLMCSEKSQGGELILVDSRANANRGYETQFRHLFENKTYLPSSGEYLVFPSHVYHHTIPFTGKLRLAMAVDLFL